MVAVVVLSRIHNVHDHVHDKQINLLVEIKTILPMHVL